MENKPEKTSNNPTGKNGGGHRQTYYNSAEHDPQANGFALLGYSVEQIADAMYLPKATFRRWIRENPSFRQSLIAGKELADSQVATAFFKLCTGFTQIQQKPVGTKDGAEVVTFEETIPPNHIAVLNWLKNRQPGIWSDKHQLEHSGEIDVTMNLGKGKVISNVQQLDQDDDGVFK